MAKAIKSRKNISSSLFRKRMQKFIHNWLAVIGLAYVLLLTLALIFIPLLTEYSPTKPDFSAKYLIPSIEHFFGTDALGRDMFSRILYGGRISIMIGMVSAVSTSFIGVVLGSISGYFGGKLDKSMLRLSELVQTFPQMILVMIVMAFIGQGIFNLILIFSITGWVGTYRLVRAEFLSLKEETYVEVCRGFGMSKAAIIFKQILPSVCTLVILDISGGIPGYIISEAGLSFIGVGVPSSIPTWGTLLNAARSVNILLHYPWVWLVPGGAICLFVLTVNCLGDGLRDVFDPRQQ